MVEGIEQFIKHFDIFHGAFVVIGGTACAAVLEDAGLLFRTTKDIDIVLIAEALDESFMEAFWNFIEEGQYLIRESAEGKRILYRFEKPQRQGFPPCLELFSRALLKGNPSHGHKLKVQAPGARHYLSAILMDDDYYHFAVIEPGTQIKIPEKIQADLAIFLIEGFKDWEPDMKSLGLGNIGIVEIVNGLRNVYFAVGAT